MQVKTKYHETGIYHKEQKQPVFLREKESLILLLVGLLTDPAFSENNMGTPHTNLGTEFSYDPLILGLYQESKSPIQKNHLALIVISAVNHNSPNLEATQRYKNKETRVHIYSGLLNWLQDKTNLCDLLYESIWRVSC